MFFHHMLSVAAVIYLISELLKISHKCKLNCRNQSDFHQLLICNDQCVCVCVGVSARQHIGTLTVMIGDWI